MPKVDRVCTEILNEIISKYSRSKFETADVSGEESEVGEEPKETEEEFWNWFCSGMKDTNFKKCFLDSDREDFYGALKTVREQYESKCK